MSLLALLALLALSAPTSLGACGDECCPLGWSKFVGSASADDLNATASGSCVVAKGGDDTVVAATGSALYAHGGPGADVIEGNTRRDGLVGGAGNDQLFGHELGDQLDGSQGDDVLGGGAGPDVLFGGAGDDVGSGGVGSDQLWLGGGNDVGNGGPGNDSLYGGPGNDDLSGGEGKDLLVGGPDSDSLNGGAGDDRLSGGLGDDDLFGGDGADALRGGPGRDSIYGGGGDDRIRIASPCEVSAGEVIDGGPGTDTLYTHLSEDELIQAGVTITNIENVVVFESRPSASVCFYEDLDDGYAELIVTVPDETTFWRTPSGDVPLDGTNHHGRGTGLMRHFTFSVESVVSSTGVRIEAGDLVDLLRPGGTADFADGTSLGSLAHGRADPVVGRRYRVALRWDRENDEFRYLTDAAVPDGPMPMVQLPLFGTLPFGPDAAPDPWAASWGTDAPELIRSGAESRPVLAGRGGPDVLWSDNRLAQMSGGDGFDVLLASAGAKRLSLDAHGGIAWAGGSSGAVFQLGRGFSIAIGSPGPDVVHLWGGFNIVLLGDGDDLVQVHRPSVAWVWGAQGSDTVCADEGVHLGGVFADVEGRDVCVAAPRTPNARRALMGVVRAHRAVEVENGVIMDDPYHQGDGHVQEFRLEVWAVVDGSDPGVRAIATEAGGWFERGPGDATVSSTPYGNRIPELDVPKLFMLEPTGRHDFWRYVRPSRQGPDHGTPLVPGQGLVSPL